jgi:hypothetical protein
MAPAKTPAKKTAPAKKPAAKSAPAKSARKTAPVGPEDDDGKGGGEIVRRGGDA